MLIGGIGLIALESSDVLSQAGVDWSDGLLMGIGAFSIIIGLLSLIVAYFLWKGKAIGWYLAMIYLVINAIYGIISIISGNYSGTLSLLIVVFLIWYFFRPSVKGYFGL